MRCIGCTPEYLPSYQAFARRQFGPSAYQATDAYLHWLYRDNPYGADLSSDLLIGVTEDQAVVGCIHQMRVLWRVHDELVVVPALHNLMVAPEYRRGLGGLLVMLSVTRHRHALILGAAEPVASMYRSLGCRKVESIWCRKLLRPLKAAGHLGAKKFLGLGARARYFLPGGDGPSELGPLGRLETAPGDALLAQLADAMNQGRAACAAPHVDVEFLRWRFFHPHGARHAVVYLPREGRLRGFFILSLGPRNGTNVGRIVAAAANSYEDFATLATLSEAVVRRLGGTILLAYCADRRLNSMFTRFGWRAIPSPPKTYLYHRDKNSGFPESAFLGYAGDLGFEAIPPPR